MPARDKELIRAYLDGDREAIAEVDGWIAQAAWPFKRRLSRIWDDTLQDVRLEITRLLASDKFRGDASLKTYLWRVTANACVDKVRAQRRVRFEDLDVVDQWGEAPKKAALEDAFRGESRDLMLRVLAEMSEDCKRLWSMIFAGLSYQEMSRRTGISEGALRVRVLRCRKKALAVREELQSKAPYMSSNGIEEPEPKQARR